MRGKERDDLVNDPIFRRFLPGGQSNDPSMFLVCTSAGEVGVNISADHLVCDLSTFDSMAQRFGRVNRFGQRDDSEVHVIHPKDGDFSNDDYDQRRAQTLTLLRNLKGDASPKALGDLDPDARRAAFAPTPTTLPATDILFDAWVLTTIRDKLPGRPPVEPYLYGLPTAWQPPETQVAWREEVERLNRKPWTEWESKVFDEIATDLLDKYPVKPHELLKDNSRRVFDRLKKLTAPPETTVWLQSDDGAVQRTTLSRITAGDADDLSFLTVILPPSAGGLNGQGMLDDKATDRVKDVADDWFIKDADDELIRQRKRPDVEDDPELENMHPVVTIEFPGSEGDDEADGDVWRWLVLNNEGDRTAKQPVLWCVHVTDVVNRTKEIVKALPLDDVLKRALDFAARFHDHGKLRKLFQTMLGNSDMDHPLAKSGKKGLRFTEVYRHEFGSLVDLLNEDKEYRAEFDQLSADEQELVLHFIAAHHGRARPHFPADEEFDPDAADETCQELASEIPRRFARLQRRFGRWGLAYLESLLRAADWAASANPTQERHEEQP